MGKKPFSNIRPREKSEFYCEVADRDVQISKWYKGFGNPRRVDDPEVYTLVCLQPYKEVKGKQFGCGNERLCPLLYREWIFEKTGKYPDDFIFSEELKKPPEQAMPSEKLDLTVVKGSEPAPRNWNTVDRDKRVHDNAVQYMIYVSNLYKSSQNKVIGLNSIKTFFGEDPLLGRKVVSKICSLGMGELFSESNNNPSFKLDLGKMRKYIKENPEDEI
jgi:hypothetical protein